MKRLLTLTLLAVTLFLAQPGRAQQQDTQKGNMEMMQDSTMMKTMMQNMHGDSTMSGMQGMMDGKMGSMCMKMCMNMMNKKKNGMDMDKKNMPNNNNKDNGG